MQNIQHQAPNNGRNDPAVKHVTASSPQAAQAVPTMQQAKMPLPQSPAAANHHQRQGSMSSPSPQMPQSPDPVHDLPQELLDAGWRQFWSKREGRNYFFNKVTRESLWEMPCLGDRGASRHDPLGIQTDPRAVHPHPDPRAVHPHPGVVSPVGMLPRRHSMEESPLSPTTSIRDFKGEFWDFTVNSNAVIYERYPSRLPPPHNDIELMRASHVQRLRHHYSDLCHQREGIYAPKESFNRWLLERKVVDKGDDPMLPSNCSREVSPSMKREIMSDIPIKLYRPRHYRDAKKLLYNYAEAAKKLIQSRKASPESRKTIKWSVEEVFRWLRTEQSGSIDEFMKRLAHLREQCGPHLNAAVQSSVEGICSKMYFMSCDIVKKLHDKHWELLKEHQIEEPAPFTRPPADKKMACYAVYAIVPSPRLPAVDVQEEGTTTCLRYKGEVMKINTAHLRKLELLYRLHCMDDKPRHNFLSRTWCLLRRYQTLFGVGQYEGHGLQGALPIDVFQCLNEHFGVTFECFASPLNCYFKQYCSAFADTDCYFGSRGPVLDFHPVSGSFEANPPFEEELMEAMVAHYERLLANTTDPLSFIIFIPEWRNPPTAALVNMEKSRFKRRQEIVGAFEHEYRSGGQHKCSEDELSYRAVHGTAIFFLQNDAGYKLWTPTDEKIELLLQAYRPKSHKQGPDVETEDEPPRKLHATDTSLKGSSVELSPYKRGPDVETEDEPPRKRRATDASLKSSSVELSPYKRGPDVETDDEPPRKRRATDASLKGPSVELSPYKPGSSNRRLDSETEETLPSSGTSKNKVESESDKRDLQKWRNIGEPAQLRTLPANKLAQDRTSWASRDHTGNDSHRTLKDRAILDGTHPNYASSSRGEKRKLK